MTKPFAYLISMTLVVGFASAAFGQPALEYGILGSKPPKSQDAGKSVSKKLQGGFRQAPTQRDTKQAQPQPKSGGGAGGPLIIEQRGDHYERVK